MQAVGRLGSYISKSVYTVSGPFHPFGGAVDIIVVEQPDGSYKSSPWYVKFGKFQGVLKTREKVVNISVNGVEADFHMYLDHKGEAFFLKEVDVEEGGSMCPPRSSSGEDTDPGNRRPLKSKSCNYDSGNASTMTRTNSRRAQLLGLVFGRRSVKEEVIKEDENANASGVVRTESLERAELAANLLDLKWSTNLASSRFKKDNGSRSSGVDISKDKNLQVDDRCNYKETDLISHSSYQEVKSTVVKENGEEMKCSTPEYVVKTCTSVDSVREDIISLNSEVMSDRLGLAKSDVHVSSLTIISEVVKSDSKIQDSGANLNNLPDTSFSLEENAADNIQSFQYLEASEMTVKESYPRSVSVHPSGESFKGFDLQSAENVSGSSNSTCPPIEELSICEEVAINKLGYSVGPLSDHQTSSSPSSIPASRNSKEEQLVFGNLDGFGPNDSRPLDFIHEVKEVDEFNQDKCCSSFSLDKSIINDYINDDNLQGRRLGNISSDVCISRTGGAKSKELTRMVRSLPVMSPLSYNLEASDLGHSSNPLLYPDVESGVNNDNQSSGALTMSEDVKKLTEGKDTPANQSVGDSPRSIDSLRRSRRGWPFSFRGSRSMKVSNVDMNAGESPISMNTAKNNGDFEGGKDAIKVKANKKIVKTLTPTSEQLASLNLKEGKNIVIFTFSTAMLGKQQVDARIFLWRWDNRIVISDVDGTITRSDLLGQVMPLVGMDWSQTGVAHLFSAIKENGYQLLFLSARSISQSFHTRQFLCTIKQDGKVLPDGPVVISPDGLFPSLFREVVRRAPHEFKIACLEDIKALFPADTNPFYAGFGNRDTDEFSYLKVGIPKGKIFIINPKGEIVVNRRVDTKSYLSLHTLVHGMFPSMSSSEQEDFNSWNYWKLPPRLIDL